MRLVFALFVFVLACQRSTAVTTDASAAGTSCAATIASYDSLVATGGACHADADCVCFNGGVSRTTPCGGVTDKATATKVDKLITDYESAHCNALMCAASVCMPVCRAGHCANDSR